MNEQQTKQNFTFDNISDRFDKAKELIENKNFSDALLLLDEILTVRPDFYHALYAKSMVLYSISDLDGAEDIWNQSWEKEWQK